MDQIKCQILDNISAKEIRGMLTLRKAQVEQTVQDEISNLCIIEARLQQAEKQGTVTKGDDLTRINRNQKGFCVNLLAFCTRSSLVRY